MPTFDELQKLADAANDPLRFPGGFGAPIPGYSVPDSGGPARLPDLIVQSHDVLRPDLVRINPNTGTVEEIANPHCGWIHIRRLGVDASPDACLTALMSC
jgi:hypothetical protein